MRDPVPCTFCGTGTELTGNEQYPHRCPRCGFTFGFKDDGALLHGHMVEQPRLITSPRVQAVADFLRSTCKKKYANVSSANASDILRPRGLLFAPMLIWSVRDCGAVIVEARLPDHQRLLGTAFLKA